MLKLILGKVEFVEMFDGMCIYMIILGIGKIIVLLVYGYGFSYIEWNVIVEGLN